MTSLGRTLSRRRASAMLSRKGAKTPGPRLRATPSMNRTLITLPDHCDAIALCGGPHSNFAAVEAFLATTPACPASAWVTWAEAVRIRIARSPGFASRTSSACKASSTTASATTRRTSAATTPIRAIASSPRLAYDYTAANTSETNKVWLRSLPSQILLEWRRKRILLVHGSPDSASEFVWESRTDNARIEAWLNAENVHAICATHSGLPWVRATLPRILVQRRWPRPTCARWDFAGRLCAAAFRTGRHDADSEPRTARLRRRSGRRRDPRRRSAGGVRTSAGRRHLDDVLQRSSARRAATDGPLCGARRILESRRACARRRACRSRLTSGAAREPRAPTVARTPFSVSIVVPTLDEAARLPDALLPLAPLRRAGHEVIVVDGGSRDGTVQVAAPLADQVLVAPRGRAIQMNTGAAVASGTTLLFLHADCRLPPSGVAAIEGTRIAGQRWGRFDVRLEGRSPLLPLIAAMMNRRSALTGICTGDQGMFVERGFSRKSAASP